MKKRNYLLIIFSIVFSSSFAQQVKDTSIIFGITIDNPWVNIVDIQEALAGHCIKPTARIVFDEFIAASEYTDPLTQIASTAFILGELLDSYYVPQYTLTEYTNRTTEYLNAFEDIVDIWEIGNEVNGDWLGGADTVVQKIQGAYDLVSARGKKTAITLYFNRDCYYDKPQNEMFTWVNANLPESMKNGLDYVLVSYYEDDCEDVILSEAEWQEVFDSLHVIFPFSKLGMGECGTINASKKAEYMNRYYNMNITTPNYIGGYFWWYYSQDCIPKTKMLWNTMNNLSCNFMSHLPEVSKDKMFFIYPNPANNYIVLVLPEKKNYQIEVIDLSGRILYTKACFMETPLLTIDVSTFTPGVYFIKTHTAKENRISKVLVY